MVRLFRVTRRAGKVPFDAKKVTKSIRPQVDRIFFEAINQWLEVFTTNVPVWRGTARAALYFATGNVGGTLAKYAGVTPDMEPTAPNQDTTRKDAIEKGKGTFIVHKPHGNTTNPDKFTYEFSYSTSVVELLMKRNWPKGARGSVAAPSPSEAAKMARTAFIRVMAPRVIKTIFIKAMKDNGFNVR